MINHCVGLHVVLSHQYFCVEWWNSFGLRNLRVDLSASVMLILVQFLSCGTIQHSTHTSPFSLHTDCYFYFPDSFIILTLAPYLPSSMPISPSYFQSLLLYHFRFPSSSICSHTTSLHATPPHRPHSLISLPTTTNTNAPHLPCFPSCTAVTLNYFQ